MLDTKGTLWGVPSAYAYGGLPSQIVCAIAELIKQAANEDGDLDTALEELTDKLLQWHQGELADVAKLAPGYIVFGSRERKHLATGEPEAMARGLTIYARARNAGVDPLEQQRRELSERPAAAPPEGTA